MKKLGGRRQRRWVLPHVSLTNQFGPLVQGYIAKEDADNVLSRTCAVRKITFKENTVVRKRALLKYNLSRVTIIADN